MHMVVENQEMRFYGKTTRGEFAWFVIFMGCLGLLGLLTLIYSLFSVEHNIYVTLQNIKIH